MTGNDVVLSDFVEQEESSNMETPKKESSEWTDEKHSLYLKSMEASFVNQLYNSLDIQSWSTQYDRPSDSMPSRKIHYPSDQFKVLQHGSWSKINFGREKPMLNEANRPHGASSNPWIQRFRNESSHGAVVSPSSHEKPSLPLTSQQFPAFNPPFCCQETSCRNTEVMDQNFVEDTMMEAGNVPCGKKRMRTSVVSKSGRDQAASYWHFSRHKNR